MIFRKQKSDDSVLLKELYEGNREFLHNVAYGVLKNDKFSEDAVHNTIVRVSKHLDKIRGFDKKEQRNYLSAVCRNAAIDIYNENKKVVPVEEIESSVSDLRVVPEDFVADKESYNELVEILNSLNSKNVIALKLCRVYNLTPEEISQIMDISEENAYKRIQRGRKELSEKLEERKCKDNV